MSVPQAVLAVIREWVAKAENDLKTAAHTLTLGPEPRPTRFPFMRSTRRR